MSGSNRPVPLESKPSHTIPYSEIQMGYSNSIFQSTGGWFGDSFYESNWTEAIKVGKIPPAGKSIEHWTNFEAALKIMQEQGVNSYRFSIEWCYIQPLEDVFNTNAILDYERIVDLCIKYQIKPMVTLLHFTEPHWFSKLGGFEKEENIAYFEIFATTVYRAFNKKVLLWCTINEPAVWGLQAYINGEFPPFQKGKFQLAIDVVTNLLKAHVRVYKTLKSMQDTEGNLINENTQIGIVHNLLKFKPYNSYNPIAYGITSFLNTFTNDVVMSFLSTGIINLSGTLASSVATKHYEDKAAPSSFDFSGLNYYATGILGFNFKDLFTNGFGKFFGPMCYPDQVMGDMFLPIDPAGFENAIKDFAKLGKRVYITEIGFADNDDNDVRRQNFLNQISSVFEAMIKAGYDIGGFYLWTFADNYEWNQAYSKRFGLFDKMLQPKQSAEIYSGILQKFKGLREAEQSEAGEEKQIGGLSLRVSHR